MTFDAIIEEKICHLCHAFVWQMEQIDSIYMTIAFQEEPERPLAIYYPEPLLIAWSPKYHNRILAQAVWRPISSFIGATIFISLAFLFDRRQHIPDSSLLHNFMEGLCDKILIELRNHNQDAGFEDFDS